MSEQKKAATNDRVASPEAWAGESIHILDLIAQVKDPKDPRVLKAVQDIRVGTLAGVLGITFVEVSLERMVATMPVDERTMQPAGILHGGSSLALAETVASIGATLHAGKDGLAVGLEINANHIRMVRSGLVTAVGVPLHVGGRTSVWEVKITDDKGKLVCVSRMTAAFIPRDLAARAG